MWRPRQGRTGGEATRMSPGTCLLPRAHPPAPPQTSRHRWGNQAGARARHSSAQTHDPVARWAALLMVPSCPWSALQGAPGAVTADDKLGAANYSGSPSSGAASLDPGVGGPRPADAPADRPPCLGLIQLQGAPRLGCGHVPTPPISVLSSCGLCSVSLSLLFSSEGTCHWIRGPLQSRMISS